MYYLKKYKQERRNILQRNFLLHEKMILCSIENNTQGTRKPKGNAKKLKRGVGGRGSDSGHLLDSMRRLA